MSQVLGLDIGTTATKAVVVGLDGLVIAEGVRPSELISLQPGWSEEDPELWWSNVCELCREMPTDEVTAIGVSGMVPWTRLFSVKRPAHSHL